MTLYELAQLGAAMREAQKQYFDPRTRARSRLIEARRLERQFDAAVLQIIGDAPTQAALFNVETKSNEEVSRE